MHKKISYFLCFFSVLEKNKLHPCISCVTFLTVCYFELFVIHQFFGFHILKITKQRNTRKNDHPNWFWLYNVSMYGKYIILCEETLSDIRKFWYSQYFHRSTTVVYVKFYSFEELSSKVWLLNGHHW